MDAKPRRDAVPALWSDGHPITAHDFVYSWRRLFDPAIAAASAYQLYCIENAEQITAGKLRPSQLGVRALDDFTFEVQLQSPTSYFLPLITQFTFNAVPRHVIEAARKRGDESSWTEPQHIAVSGPFALRRWRPYTMQAWWALMNWSLSLF